MCLVTCPGAHREGAGRPFKLHDVEISGCKHSRTQAGRAQGTCFQYSDCNGITFQVVVFLSTCAGVEFHHALLSQAAPTATGARVPGRLFKLHGNLPQVHRLLTDC